APDQPGGCAGALAANDCAAGPMVTRASNSGASLFETSRDPRSGLGAVTTSLSPRGTACSIASKMVPDTSIAPAGGPARLTASVQLHANATQAMAALPISFCGRSLREPSVRTSPDV